MTKKDLKAAEVLANRKVAFAKRVATLTGHVAGRTSHAAMMAAFNSGLTPDAYAAEIAAREPVGAALHPLKVEAIQAAAADAAVTVGYVTRELEKHGWDINAAAPYPMGYSHTTAGRVARAKHDLYQSLVTSDPALGCRFSGRGAPHIVIMSEPGIARFVQRAEEGAAAQYDAFICKMVAKIGPDAVSATINGNHVWDHSILTVFLKSGEIQRWKTQQIWNYSVHGLRFPQWPSRIIK